MKRILAVLLIATFTTLTFGVDERSWAAAATLTGDQAATAQVARQLAGVRRGSTVVIELADGTRLTAVIETVEPDALTVMVDDRGGVARRTIPVIDIISIRAKPVITTARVHRELIKAAIAAGVIVGLLVVCKAAVPAPTPREQ